MVETAEKKDEYPTELAEQLKAKILELQCPNCIDSVITSIAPMIADALKRYPKEQVFDVVEESLEGHPCYHISSQQDNKAGTYGILLGLYQEVAVFLAGESSDPDPDSGVIQEKTRVKAGKQLPFTIKLRETTKKP